MLHVLYFLDLKVEHLTELNKAPKHNQTHINIDNKLRNKRSGK